MLDKLRQTCKIFLPPVWFVVGDGRLPAGQIMALAAPLLKSLQQQR